MIGTFLASKTEPQMGATYITILYHRLLKLLVQILLHRKVLDAMNIRAAIVVIAIMTVVTLVKPLWLL